MPVVLQNVNDRQNMRKDAVAAIAEKNMLAAIAATEIAVAKANVPVNLDAAKMIALAEIIRVRVVDVAHPHAADPTEIAGRRANVAHAASEATVHALVAHMPVAETQVAALQVANEPDDLDKDVDRRLDEVHREATHE